MRQPLSHSRLGTVHGFAMLAALSLITSAAAAQTKRAFKPADWYSVQQVSGPTLSPDGTRIAFTVGSVIEKENRRHSEVWMVPTNGGEAMRMTSPMSESSGPCWSADSKTLYFTSSRLGDRGLHALRMDAPGEAAPVSGTPTLATATPPAPLDQPADRSFTVRAGAGGPGAAAADAGGGRGGRGGGGGGGCGGGGGRAGGGGAPGESDGGAEDESFAPRPFSGISKEDAPSKIRALARPPCGAITKPEDSTRYDGRHIVQPNFRSNNGGFTVPSTNCNDAGGGRAGGGGPGGRGGGGGAGAAGAGAGAAAAQIFITRGTAAPKQITNTKYSHRNVVVSPDGKWIAFTADAQLRADADVPQPAGAAGGRGGQGGRAGGGGGGRAAAPRIDPQGKPLDPGTNDTEVFTLPVAACEAGTAACTPKKIEFDGSESALSISPDGKWVVFQGRPGGNRIPRLYAAPTAGGKAVDLWGNWVYEPGAAVWSANNTITMQVTTGGSSGLYRIDPAAAKVTPIIGGDRRIGGITWTSDHTKIYYTSSSHAKLNEIYVINADGTGEKQLTNVNGKLNSEVAFSEGERFTYKSVGDLEIEGWLVKPYGYEPGKKFPLVLSIHGGPHSAYGAGWFDEFQSLAGAGFWVLFTNPRGSSGTNAEFTNSTRGRWGAEDYDDLMKAVDIAAKRADVDSTRMGVLGGSYGGFMTAWITTKTNRFKAAETDRMISDWVSWWGMSDAQSLTNGEFFGRPWENIAMYDSLSPIRGVQNVRTPTLMVQSEEDFRTPMGNADLWFQALRAQGVPAEFVRYPRSTHELSRSGEPWLLVDRLSRINQWFRHWLITNPTPANTAGGPRTP